MAFKAITDDTGKVHLLNLAQVVSVHHEKVSDLDFVNIITTSNQLTIAVPCADAETAMRLMYEISGLTPVARY